MKSTGDLFQICSESFITTGDLSHAEMDCYSESFIEWWPLPSLCWMVSNLSPNLPFPQDLRQNFSDFKLNCWTGYHLAAPFDIFLSSTRWIETHHALCPKYLALHLCNLLCVLHNKMKDTTPVWHAAVKMDQIIIDWDSWPSPGRYSCFECRSTASWC